MPGQAQSAAGRAGGLPSPASSLAPRWPVHPLSALVALGWGEQPVPAGGGAPGPGVTAGCGAHGGTMQGDTPSQTCGLQTPGHLWEPPPQQGDAKHLCICVHGAHAAARPPRGHASPHSAHAERAWALEDVRPGFESHPNPHDPVRTRSASEPGTSAAGRRGARPALQALLGLGPQSPSLRGVRSVTCATTRQGHLLSPLSR